MNRKTTVRREARDRLRSISPDEGTRWGARIAERVWSAREIQSARTILLYASLPEEVPTGEIADEARRQGVVVTYPRCLPEGRQMSFHVVQTPTDLTPGRYGISEPAPHCPLVELGEIDVAIIPGLAWDRSGHRLGRGAGYYDRVLASPRWRAVRCGLFFAAQEFPAVPVDDWDADLDLVITEREIWRP